MYDLYTQINEQAVAIFNYGNGMVYLMDPKASE